MNLSMDLMQRAVAIADSAARSDVECIGVPLGDMKLGRYGLVNGRLSEVRSIHDADAQLVEAFEYLRDRGLASLSSDTCGDVIQLHLERFVP